MRLAFGPVVVVTVIAGWPASPQAQELLPPAAAPAQAERHEPEARTAPETVEVRPSARDDEIQQRIQSIMQATGWFTESSVRVEQGVVFLSGTADDEEKKEWAGGLAKNTRDVVAVVNELRVPQPALLDLTPALRQVREMWGTFLRKMPLIAFGLLVLVVTALIATLVTRVMRLALRRRVMTPLLREVIARAAGIGVLVLGLYFILLVAGLARLAVTVLTGTGLVGLIIGIAFRDITENFLASIFLSMQHPFRTGDLVEIEGVLGLVQRLTIRTTIVMTLDGNHVQIPNSIVYKSNIRNYTSNPNRREDFLVGIGYEDTISSAQDVALLVLKNHPAVLKEPEPWVLVDNLGKATVNLRVYFWLDGTQHSWLKVRSSVIRLVKRAFQEQGVSMPDEAREVVFPQGVPVHVLSQQEEMPALSAQRPAPGAEAAEFSTAAEASLASDAGNVQEQANRSRVPEEGEDLL